MPFIVSDSLRMSRRYRIPIFIPIIRRPKVRMINGVRMSFKIGLIIRFATVKMDDANIKSIKLPMKVKFWTKWSEARIAIMLENIWKMIKAMIFM